MGFKTWWATLSLGDKTTLSVGFVTAIVTVASGTVFAIAKLWPSHSPGPIESPTTATSTPGRVSKTDELAPASCTRKNKRDPKDYLSGTLNIGINGSLPGWSKWNGPDITPSGFDGSLIEFLKRRHGFYPHFVRLTPEERAERLADCSVDLVIANYSITEKRDRGYYDTALGRPVPPVDFAGPYFHDRSGILCRHTRRIDCSKEISQEVICVVRGTTAFDELKDAQLEDSTLKCMERFYNPDDPIVAYSTDETILKAYGASVGRVGVAVWAGGNNPISDEYYGIGLPDDSPVRV